MAFALVKVIVGILLTVNFATQLYGVARSRHLWEEPVAALAGNMSLICMLIGINLLLVGAYDVVHLDISGVCQALQYIGFGFGFAFKMAQVCMAVDQYVAVAYPAQQLSITSRARGRLFAATWLTWAAQVTVGVLAASFGLQTHADSIHGLGNGTAVFPGCRWESSLAMVYAILVDVQLVLFSLATAGLFAYTFTIGFRNKARLNRQIQEMGAAVVMPEEDRKFFENYNDFKKVVWVFSITVPLDIIIPVLRFSSRWYPMARLNSFLFQLRLLGLMFEGWGYGLMNTKLKAAYKKALCGKCCSDMIEPLPLAAQNIPTGGHQELQQ